jgi:type I restriction enzyme R subunit
MTKGNKKDKSNDTVMLNTDEGKHDSKNENTNKDNSVTLSLSKGGSRNGTPKNDLIALVSLIRHVCGIDASLMPYDKTVDRNFQQWILKKNAGQHNRFTEEQMAWLRMMKEHIASSFHLEREDLDYAPFDSKGGLGKMWQLFGEKTDEIINELNEELVA